MSLGTINAVTNVSTSSSNGTTISSTKVFMHLQSFTYSPFSQSLWHSQSHILEFQTKSFSHAQCFVDFLHSHWHLSLSHFCFELNFYHQNFICLHMKCVLQVFLILLLLSSCWSLSNLCLLFYWEHIFYQINFQLYYRFHHTCLD